MDPFGTNAKQGSARFQPSMFKRFCSWEACSNVLHLGSMQKVLLLGSMFKRFCPREAYSNVLHLGSMQKVLHLGSMQKVLLPGSMFKRIAGFRV